MTQSHPLTCKFPGREHLDDSRIVLADALLERRRQKALQIKMLERRSDSIGARSALGANGKHWWARPRPASLASAGRRRLRQRPQALGRLGIDGVAHNPLHGPGGIERGGLPAVLQVQAAD